MVAIKDLDVQEQVYRLLIDAGAGTDEVSQALVNAVSAGPAGLTILRLLLTKASVDFDGAKALCLAVEKFNLEQLTLLLGKKPSLESINAAFSTAMKFAVEKTKHDVFELLLESAALGEQKAEARVVITNLKGEALVSACVAKNVQLVELLIQNYAPVNFQNGAVLVAAVKDAENFPLVMATTPKPSLATLTAAFKEAIKLGKPALQFSVYSMLLDAGMKGELVDAALLAAVEIGSSAKATYTLPLDSGADIDHSNGASMRAAIDSESVELLELLLTKGKASQPNLA